MDHWICFLGFLRVAFGLTNAPYGLHHTEATFDQAAETCRLTGFLTDMAEEEEAKKILSLIEEKTNHAGTLEFWVGLRKTKHDCVLEDYPLKGFKWTASNSSETKVSKWKEQPAQTCISLLCGLLAVDYSGNKVTDWGWIASSCKEKHPFICKTNADVAEIEPSRPECDTPTIFDAFEPFEVGDNPQLLKVRCRSNATFTLTCPPGSKEWTLESGSGEITEMCLACEPGYARGDTGSCIDIDECAHQPCESSCTNTQGSYTCACEAATGYVPSQGSASCEKLAMPTDPPAGTPVASTTPVFLPLTHPAPQATNGKGPPPSLPAGPAPTPGGSVTVETSGDPPGLWIPVLAAVLSLVFLVAIGVVVARCCLRKRSKKLSKEKGGKSKETVVLKAADSLEDINQKEIV